MGSSNSGRQRYVHATRLPKSYTRGVITRARRDMRFAEPRMARLLYDGIISDLGGDSEVSVVAAGLAEAFAFADTKRRILEAKAHRTGEDVTEQWAMYVGHMVRIAGHLGVSRRAKPLQDLRTYLASKAAPAPSAAPAASTAVVEQAACGTDQEEARRP